MDVTQEIAKRVGKLPPDLQQQVLRFVASLDAAAPQVRPKQADSSGFPNADDEYTPEQRRATDALLAKSDEDIKHGRTHGPFNTAEEMAASIETKIKKLRRATRRSRSAR
jgi:hypothetical protein